DNILSYRFQLSASSLFQNNIIDTVLDMNQFQTTAMQFNTNYFWKVTPINACISGNISPTFSFTTQSLHEYDIFVPDNAFEEALIELGYDSGPIDNYVARANIENVTFLELSEKGIADLT